MKKTQNHPINAGNLLVHITRKFSSQEGLKISKTQMMSFPLRFSLCPFLSPLPVSTFAMFGPQFLSLCLNVLLGQGQGEEKHGLTQFQT